MKGLGLQLDVIGMESVNKMLHIWRKIAETPMGVNLNSVSRQGDDFTNGQLLRWHAHKEGKNWPYPKRDFITGASADNEAIAKQFAKTIDIETQKQLKRDLRYERLRARSVGGKYTTRTGRVRTLKAPPDAKRRAVRMSSVCLRESMVVYMRQVYDRIKAVRSAVGTIPEYSPRYRDKKMKKKGFLNPKLVWTAQLLENLDSSGLATKNIRITKN